MLKAIDHAFTITMHRDHTLVDKAMVHALLDLLGQDAQAVTVRLYRVLLVQGELQVSLAAWSEDHQARADAGESDAADLPIETVRTLKLREPINTVSRDPNGQESHVTLLPVARHEELLGCIELQRLVELSVDERRLIQGMCQVYANYLSLLSYSQIDTLTHLLNRKTFDENLQQLLTEVTEKSVTVSGVPERRAEPRERTNWVAVMDIDHFKRVNDNYGHLFGDEVLILVASVMRSAFRRQDKLFRFGGEEFVVLLRNTDEQNAIKALERFRNAIESHVFPQLGQVTISIGLTKVRPYDSPPALLGRADEALYFAKKNGRNQVQFFDALEQQGKLTPAAVVHTEAELF